ncbi:LOW QUALITY PROTEIN: suppression of tumorigenicity 5 protein [Hypomesus transpacificus]|uniref:LOW QUALITY PROTEIN: suppression of tumorigenicity 5 protein n=1 Tax=Hypomesus transpacificus TaxID=137520 RepID=UPI001F07F785|nr:LOW QUALITY PROTEIN: suppression of tumorigenicity 5 protein [Hypomesus transpacificus]
MTANKSAKAAPRSGGCKVSRDIPERCQSASPPPILSPTQGQHRSPLSDSEDSGKQSRYVRTDGRLLGKASWGSKAGSLRSGASLSTAWDAHNRLTKSKSISCLDNKLSIYKPSGPTAPVVVLEDQGDEAQHDAQKQEQLPGGDGLSDGPLSWSTLSLGPSTNHGHKRSLSLSRPAPGASSATIRKKISEWECRRVALPRMSLCLEKRPGSERVGGSEGCPSLLSSPCSEKTFDFKGIRRMSTAFSECSYPETEEEEAASDREGLGRFQKRIGKKEPSGIFLRSLSARKDTSAVLSRIQKIEQALKESPGPAPPQYLNNCYAPDKARQKSFTIGGIDDLDSACTSKRSSICSVATEPDAPPSSSSDKLSRLRQRFSVSSTRSESPEPPAPLTPGGTPVNPLPKPKRTFEYDADRNHKGTSPSNGLPAGGASEAPPPLPSTPAPSMMRAPKTDGSSPKRLQERESCEWESAASQPSSQPSSPTENGTIPAESRSRPVSKSTLEENAYEDIVGKYRAHLGNVGELDRSSHDLVPDQSTCVGLTNEARVCVCVYVVSCLRANVYALPHGDGNVCVCVCFPCSETFSFMLTGEDGSRRFGYCRRLLPSGKGPRLPEVYCVISRLGCFDLFSKILDEVERRRGVSAALVYPFMRSLMESPFPAPGKTIKVKTFLPGAGNEVIELRRPMDSRLEHVDFHSLFSCLGVRQVVRVFASLLLERRVIFVADNLSTLSSCIHAVVALLYPFSWQHTFIPVLPASMVDIVCCPTPFLVGLLSSSLPKLKDLPVEEALMVDLGTDRFIRQMDDEASLLPRKLQAALEQALEQRNDIINQDSDSESDEECNSLNSLVSEAFIRFFLETIGHYSLFLTQNERGERIFQREAFRKSVASKSIRRFLGVFMESQMFAGFIQDRELRKCRAKGLFERRVEQYLEELPDTEQSGVNKFLKGLGSKMKFLHKKN